MIFELLYQGLERASQGKRRGLELGRDLAKHAYAQVRDTMDPEFVASSEAYWRITDAYIDREYSRDELLAAKREIPKIIRRGDNWSSLETPVLAGMLYLLCLRFEEEGVQASRSLLRDLAKDAQLEVAKDAAKFGDVPKRAFAAARWEEARWQLQHIIATEPNLADR